MNKENISLKLICMDKDSNNNLSNKIIKLQEEAGEVASEYLKLTSTSNASKSADGTVESLFEEVIDTIMVAEDILYKIKKDNQEIDLDYDKILNRKLNKWFSKIEMKGE